MGCTACVLPAGMGLGKTTPSSPWRMVVGTAALSTVMIDGAAGRFLLFLRP